MRENLFSAQTCLEKRRLLVEKRVDFRRAEGVRLTIKYYHSFGMLGSYFSSAYWQARDWCDSDVFAVKAA